MALLRSNPSNCTIILILCWLVFESYITTHTYGVGVWWWIFLCCSIRFYEDENVICNTENHKDIFIIYIIYIIDI